MSCVKTPDHRAFPGDMPQFLALCLAILMAPSGLFAAAPVIDTFTADPAAVSPGAETVLLVTAHDPDCADSCTETSPCGTAIRADLTQWTADGGSFPSEDNGTTGSPYSATATWQAPLTEGIYTIDISVSDSATTFCGGGRQTTMSSLSVQVTTTPNAAPVIDRLDTSASQLFPNATADLTCAAGDPDGETVTYAWTSDAGTVTPGITGEAVFESAVPALATVTCTAADPQGATDSASLLISVSDAVAEDVVTDGLGAPRRLAVDSMGDVYVVDGEGITVLRLVDGERVYRLPLADAHAVAVDWMDDLLIGGRSGARVVDRRGMLLLDLEPDAPLGAVADVAVDATRQRYAVLHGQAGRVVVYDASGNVIAAVGTTGDGPGELRGPRGLAIAPNGDLVVADSGHGRVAIFDLAGTLVGDFGALGAGPGNFVALDAVAVSDSGVIFAADTFQDWVQSWNGDGTLREVLGTWGEGPGRFKTPAGLQPVADFNRLVVASLNSSSLQVFRLSGSEPSVWPAPHVALSTLGLNFGSRMVGATGPSLTVNLSNPGDAPLGILGSLTSGDFTAGDNCAGVLDPGRSCLFYVAFLPAAPGPRDGALFITTSTGEVAVALAGSGYLPAALAYHPTSLEFPDQAVNTTSAPLTMTLRNLGTVPLGIGGIQPSYQFGVAHGCGNELAGGASCTVDVYFSPQMTGDELSGVLTITASDSALPRQVSLEGRAVTLELSPSPALVDFGQLEPGDPIPPRTVTVINTGTEIINVEALVIDGEHWEVFALGNDLCSGALLFVDEACTFEVTFQESPPDVYHAQVDVFPSGLGPVSVSLVARSGLLFGDGFETGDTKAWSRTSGAAEEP